MLGFIRQGEIMEGFELSWRQARTAGAYAKEWWVELLL